MKTYKITRTSAGVTVSVEMEGKGAYTLTPELSQQIYNHSPDGFEFGYSGSGPAQLALAIMLDYFGIKSHKREVTLDSPAGLQRAVTRYQDFKFKFIAGLPREGGQITSEQIERFLEC